MKAPKSKAAAVKTKAKAKGRAAKGKAVENLPKTAEEDESKRVFQPIGCRRKPKKTKDKKENTENEDW
ncbi:unnamed protein product, partial [Durusdinium trenchii]